MKVSGVKAGARRVREAVQVGLAAALTLGAIGAGYVAGKAASHGAVQPAVELIGDADHAAEARVEGLLLLLLGRGGVL